MRYPDPSEGPVLVLASARRSWRRDASGAGWDVVADGAVPDAWELAGVMVRTSDPETAALVVARGGGAHLVGEVPDDARQVLVDDVGRLGGRVWTDADAAAEVGSSDVDELMAALVDGDSVGVAARKACMSLRTAQRRLDALRRQFGVTTTAGVVAVWSRERTGAEGAGGGGR